MSKFTRKEIAQVKEEIISAVEKRVCKKASDALAIEKNRLHNESEYKEKKITLASLPEGLGIGAHYGCNSRCVFCLGGRKNVFSLQRYKEFFEPRLRQAISKARYITFCGFGEFLIMPGIEDFLGYVNETLPVTKKVYTTNGTSLLNNNVLALLSAGKNVLQISLHASYGRLHKLLTNTDNFDAIVAQLKKLIALRRHPEEPAIHLVFLITTLNIEDLPKFIEFAAELGAPGEILCSYMTIFNPAHLKLSCFFKQALTNACLDRAQEVADKFGIILKLPPKFGNLSSQDGHICKDPWVYFYVENEGLVVPCCKGGDYFGNLNTADFEAIWNGKKYNGLRRSLAEGPVHPWCQHCYLHKSENVNNIRSHISFRPRVQRIFFEKNGEAKPFLREAMLNKKLKKGGEE